MEVDEVKAYIFKLPQNLYANPRLFAFFCRQFPSSYHGASENATGNMVRVLGVEISLKTRFFLTSHIIEVRFFVF